MARTPKNYAINTQLSTPGSEVLIVPIVDPGVTSTIRKLSFINTSTTSKRLVVVHAVEASGSPSTSNEIARRSITPQKTWGVIEGQGETLEAGASIQASQDVGADVNANCSGADVS